MSTTLAQVLDRLDVLLKAAAPVGTQVFRERAEADSRSEAPAINVSPRECAIESFSAEMDKHLQIIEVRLHVRADPPTPAVEAIHLPVHVAIATDAVLAALVESIRIEDTVFAEHEADATALDKTCRYRFTFLISKTTL